jgi:hypothetical protein
MDFYADGATEVGPGPLNRCACSHEWVEDNVPLLRASSDAAIR